MVASVNQFNPASADIKLDVSKNTTVINSGRAAVTIGARSTETGSTNIGWGSNSQTSHSRVYEV